MHSHKTTNNLKKYLNGLGGIFSHAPFSLTKEKGARREHKAKLCDSVTSQWACADGAKKKTNHLFFGGDGPFFSQKERDVFEPATSHFFGKFFLFLKVFFLLRKKSLLQSARATTAPRAHFILYLRNREILWFYLMFLLMTCF